MYIFCITLILLMKGLLIKKASLTAVDQWYWLKYRDAVRSQKTCPPNLPEYILEIKQWYPPLFGCFLSTLPDFIFKYSNLLTQILSIVRLSFIFILVYLLNIDFSFSLYLAIIIYLTAPILIYYDNQINSRIFGAILVDLLILLFFGYFEYDLLYLLIPIILVTTILLLTHKMSHQLYLFLLFGLSIFYMSFVPIVIYIFSNIIAIIFFNYKNYLQHHIEIIKFWHRNRYKLGAHQFYESKIYGKGGFVHINRLHGNGMKSFIKKSLLIIGMFPFIIFILFNFEFNFFGFIIFMTLIFIFLTSFIDYFLCLGAGNLYTYNLVSFSSLYLVLTSIDYTSDYNRLLLSIVFLMTVMSIYKFYIGLNKKNKDNDYEDAMEFIKKSSIDRIIAIPLTPSDEIVYKTNKKVFWGGHGYGFKYLEPYFPVFNKKVEATIIDWNIGGIFLKKDYWPEFFDKVDSRMYTNLYENSKYIVLKINFFKNKDIKPLWTKKIYKDLYE